jgi:hypothetical protein
MGIRYVGKTPSSIDRYTEHSNVNRWMHVPKQKKGLRFYAEYWPIIISVIVAIAALIEIIWFMTI